MHRIMLDFEEMVYLLSSSQVNHGVVADTLTICLGSFNEMKSSNPRFRQVLNAIDFYER